MAYFIKHFYHWGHCNYLYGNARVLRRDRFRVVLHKLCDGEDVIHPLDHVEVDCREVLPVRGIRMS